jgi:hypothetical protein
MDLNARAKGGAFSKENGRDPTDYYRSIKNIYDSHNPQTLLHAKNNENREATISKKQNKQPF